MKAKHPIPPAWKSGKQAGWHRQKLTPHAVREIRRITRFFNGPHFGDAPLTRLAKQFGVSKSTIMDARYRRTYRWVI